MFDITSQAVNEAATIHIKSAAGELLYADEARTLPVRIRIYGPGSKAAGLVDARQSSRAVRRMQDNDGKITVAPFEERLQETAEDLAALTIDFENVLYPPAGDARGAELFTAVYADQSLGFIVKQVKQFLGDWGNFRGA